jgi:cobalt-precorrin 5A hydrolase/precorrin-3B C17-methyltransferase
MVRTAWGGAGDWAARGTVLSGTVPVIGLIAVTEGGRAAAQRLAAAWPGQTRTYDGPARQALPRAWAQCDGLVCFLAVGATVRLIAPLLDSKWTDPAVVCVDESARRAVAVVGGHAAGANALAVQVAAVFGADAVITTATDAVSLPGLDTLGWPTEGAIGRVSRALLDGERVRLESAETWPLPPLPATVGDEGECRILITDRVLPGDPRTAVVRPPSLVIGVHVAHGVAAEEILRLADSALGEAGLSAASVAAVATGQAAASEPGLAEAAQERGWPLVSYQASQLIAATVPQRGQWRLTRNGAVSLAETAAMAGAAELVVPERSSATAAVAVARVRPRGRLALIGTGPGPRDLVAPRAVAELRRASVVACPGRSADELGDVFRAGTRVLAGKPGEDEECGREAVRHAREGHAVAIAFPADPGMHALASLVLDLAGDDVDLVEVPGVTAGLASAAVLGAPLGSSHTVIAPGEHTPWPVTEAQVRAAAEADLVVTFCVPPGNPAGQRLRAVLSIMRQHRPGHTPVAVVRDPYRADHRVQLGTLADLEAGELAERSVLVVGSSHTRVVAGRMVTREDG